MSKKSLEPMKRKQDIRQIQKTIPTQFTLSEITDHFQEILCLCRRQLNNLKVTHSSVSEGTNTNEKMELDFKLRMIYSYAESAFDFYLHEMNKYGMLAAFDG